jgi:hypothetical protein
MRSDTEGAVVVSLSRGVRVSHLRHTNQQDQTDTDNPQPRKEGIL